MPTPTTELVLLLGIVCNPHNIFFRNLARTSMLQLAPTSVQSRFVVTKHSKVSLGKEQATHMDLVFLDCVEGGGLVKHQATSCKTHKWFQYALKNLPRAHFYAKFEDDHFINLRALVNELHMLEEFDFLYYGLMNWADYTFPVYPGRFNDSDDYMKFILAEHLTNRGQGCLNEISFCAHKMVTNSTDLFYLHDGNKKKSSDIRGKDMEFASFMFGASGDIRSHDLTKAIALCVFANNYDAKRGEIFEGSAKQIHAPHNDTLSTRMIERRIAGGDATQGLFVRMCAPSAFVTIAHLPLTKFHNGPVLPGVKTRLARKVSEDSIFVHNLKFDHGDRIRRHNLQTWKSCVEMAEKVNITTHPPILTHIEFGTLSDPFFRAKHPNSWTARSNEHFYAAVKPHEPKGQQVTPSLLENVRYQPWISNQVRYASLV
jgi:hypothetical protein